MVKIINHSRYKPSEVVQILSLFTMWGSLGRKMIKEIVCESSLEEWSKLVLNDMRQVFCRWKIGFLEGKGIDRET